MAKNNFLWLLPRRLYLAVRHSTDEDADVFAACISFYMFMWLLLIAVVLFASSRIVLRNYVSEETVREALHAWVSVQTSEQTADKAIEFILQGSIEDNTMLTAGIFGIFITGASVFVWIERAFSRIWGIKYPKSETLLMMLKHVLLDRLRAFAFLMMVTLLAIGTFLTILFLSQYTAEVEEFFGVKLIKPMYYTASFFLNWLLVSLLFWLMPRTKVTIGHALRGSLLCAIVWEVGRLPLEYLVMYGKLSTYGLFGVMVAIMLWVFYATRVVLTGASYVWILERETRMNKKEQT